VDRISREKTSTKANKDLLRSFCLPEIPFCLMKWLLFPSDDGELSEHWLCFVIEKLNNI
jgi:hypothetical protein